MKQRMNKIWLGLILIIICSLGYVTSTCNGDGPDGNIVDLQECDDSNGIDQDDCTNQCVNATCGDGIKWDQENGQQECDDGNDDNFDDCINQCRRSTCLDGFINVEGEECDDGNRDKNDQCGNDCKFTNCGNGLIDEGEECDDANDRINDGCDDQCRRENKNYVLPLAIGIPVIFLALAGLTFWKCTGWKQPDNKGRIIQSQESGDSKTSQSQHHD